MKVNKNKTQDKAVLNNYLLNLEDKITTSHILTYDTLQIYKKRKKAKQNICKISNSDFRQIAIDISQESVIASLTFTNIQSWSHPFRQLLKHN